MRLTILFLAALALPAPAAAQDPRLSPSPSFRACMASGDAALGKGAAVDLCLGAEQALQERRMADSFRRTSDRYGWEGQERLRDDQAAWRGESAARCAAATPGDPRRGNATQTYQRCVLDQTIARVVWLDDYPAADGAQ